jgi:hypothetical protein
MRGFAVSNFEPHNVSLLVSLSHPIIFAIPFPHYSRPHGSPIKLSILVSLLKPDHGEPYRRTHDNTVRFAEQEPNPHSLF